MIKMTKLQPTLYNYMYKQNGRISIIKIFVFQMLNNS